MMSFDLIARVALLGAISAGCSSTSTTGFVADSDAGSEAASLDAQDEAWDGASDVATIDPTCVSACATVRTCYATLDEHACQVQCSIELTGAGYLIPEIATEYFQLLADVGSDPDCSQTQFAHWRPTEASPHGYVPPVADQATLKECYDEVCWSYSSHVVWEACFMSYYRYNTTYREKIRACFPYDGSVEACREEDACICQNQFPDAPWVAMPCRATDYCPYCPS